jgi:hypothetical protein
LLALRSSSVQNLSISRISLEVGSGSSVEVESREHTPWKE